MTDKKTDALGPSFLPDEKAKTEASERIKYTKIYAKVLFLQGPVVAWTLDLLYHEISVLRNVPKDTVMETKFEFLHDYQLYFMYCAIYAISGPDVPRSTESAHLPSCRKRGLRLDGRARRRRTF